MSRTWTCVEPTTTPRILSGMLLSCCHDPSPPPLTTPRNPTTTPITTTPPVPSPPAVSEHGFCLNHELLYESVISDTAHSIATKFCATFSPETPFSLCKINIINTQTRASGWGRNRELILRARGGGAGYQVTTLQQ